MRALDPQEMELLPPALQTRYFADCDNGVLFARYGVHGDGSCFFHSLCAARNTADYLHLSSAEQQAVGQKFRCKFTDFITEARWNKFLKLRNISNAVTAADARTNFCDSKFWADETMIKYVSEVLKMNIIFIDVSTDKIYCGVRGRKDEPLVLILWLNHAHFEPVFCVRGSQLPQKNELAAQFAFDMAQNEDVVRAIFKNYTAQCAV